MIESLVWLLVLLVIIIVFGTAAYASLRAAPWLPVRTKDFDRIMKAVEGHAGPFIELGVGDARIITQVAERFHISSIGYEISTIPYLAAKSRVIRVAKEHRPKILFKDFFNVSFADAKIIFCFLTPPAMKKLKEKFEKECTPGTRIISYSFSVPGWEPTVTDRNGTGIPLFIYDR